MILTYILSGIIKPGSRISIGHWLADGRAGLTALDVFLVNLRQELLGITESPTSLKWGEEIARLPPANIRAITAIDNNHVLSASTPHKNPLAPPEGNQRANVVCDLTILNFYIDSDASRPFS